MVALALRDGGYLVLGQAETPSPLEAIFAPAHPQLKIYRRQARPAGARDVPLVLPQARKARRRATTPPAQIERATPQTVQMSGTAASERVLDTVPLGVVVVDRRHDIQHINAAVLRLSQESVARLFGPAEPADRPALHRVDGGRLRRSGALRG